MYKTIYFFKLDIKKFMLPDYIPESYFYNVFDNLIEHQDVKKNTDSIWGDYLSCFFYNSLVLDILEHNNNYLFGTIGCTKSENKLRRIRNIKNLEHKEIELDANNTLEDYTFFYLDYNTGIISVINAKGAPDIKTLKYFIQLNPNYDSNIYAILNRDIKKALTNINEVSGVELRFALAPDEVFGTDGERASMDVINKFKKDGFERTEIKFWIDKVNPKRKTPNNVIEHALDIYEMIKVTDKDNPYDNNYKLEKLNIIATPQDEKQHSINLLEPYFTKGIKLKIDNNFSEKSIKEEIQLVYNVIKEELLQNISLHL